jgi:alpha-L-fucosidase 2
MLKYFKFSPFLFFLVPFTLYGQNDNLTIWFNQPATEWNNALPVGNGRLGAMIFGEVENERIQLNEESIWTGRKYDFHNPESRSGLKEVRKLIFEGKYAEAEKTAQNKLIGNKVNGSNYQTLGDLFLTFPKYENVDNYRRSLSIENAVATISYDADGVSYLREIFSSFPDQAIVIRLTASKSNSINFSASLKREGNKAVIVYSNDEITLSEDVREKVEKRPDGMDDGGGVYLHSRLKIIAEGGKVSAKGGTLKVENANAVTILLTAATDYNTKNPIKVAKDQITAAIAKPYEQIKSEHIKDYQQYFKRVDFNLAGLKNNNPTNIRLSTLKLGASDPKLIELYYQFGRYLLISSSRPGCLPANLQGIWADGLTPPWNADYHININIQMNYWPAEITNLSEMHMPFLKFIDGLREDGRKTARDMYNMKGSVAHFTTDLWQYTEPHGKTDWAMWPMGLAWCSTHLWEHYLFTGDINYLQTLAYPAMKEAALFCVNWVTEDPKTKNLVSGPSISPENKFVPKPGDTVSIVMGPTMDHMIIRHLLTATIEASVILNLDPEFRAQMKYVLDHLAPIRIGSDGRIMEWTEEFIEAEPGHRHISHLYGLHPGNQISVQTPELLTAARKSIDYRLANGGGHTGWSRAWIINFFARLQDGENAYNNLIELLKKSTLDNLFDNHPPFQIDGNFGATAGITEMLMQSHAGAIHLLPALPKAWNKGYIHGIIARGGFEVNIDWENGQLKKVTILSKLGNECKIKYGDKVISLKTEKGKKYSFDSNLNLINK